MLQYLKSKEKKKVDMNVYSVPLDAETIAPKAASKFNIAASHFDDTLWVVTVNVEASSTSRNQKKAMLMALKKTQQEIETCINNLQLNIGA